MNVYGCVLKEIVIIMLKAMIFVGLVVVIFIKFFNYVCGVVVIGDVFDDLRVMKGLM